jgi:uridine kinase
MKDITSLLSSLRTISQPHGRPLIIAISGFGGSGKSTLANQLKEKLGAAAAISIDAFVTDHLSERSADWNGFDFDRFQEEVLKPAHDGQPITYGVYDWKKNSISHTETVEQAKFLILEGCGIIQPRLLEYYDFSIWIDMPLDEATQRGIERDRSQGAFWDENWHTIWMPNDRDFFEKYHPDTLADFIYHS